MSFLIDTDICSAHLKGMGVVTSRFLQYMGRLHVSVITVGELYTWATRTGAGERRPSALRDLLSDMVILDVDLAVAERFGRLRARLLDAGRPAPPMDLWIAATAIENDLTLVTHNTADFASIPGLVLADWLGT